MLQLIYQKPRLTVSEVARRLHLPGNVASAYLRVLESRGLLKPTRISRFVQYELNCHPELEPARSLMPALCQELKGSLNDLDSVFQMATAFTHPRRIVIYQQLQHKQMSLAGLRSVTGISLMALHRHLSKLCTRGYLAKNECFYRIKHPGSEFGRALARITELICS